MQVRLFNIEALGIVGIKEVTLAQFFVGLIVLNCTVTVFVK